MSVALHSTVSRRDAIESLLKPAHSGSRSIRDGEFEASEGLVAAFFSPAAVRFTSPTRIDWRPGLSREAPPWLAEPQRLSPKYHLFIEQPAGFLYAGDAHLGSYAMDGSNATFTLYNRLPRDAWLAVGGYPHWLVEVNHKEHRLAPSEVDALRVLLSRILGPSHGHVTLTRYEEDSLHLYTNTTRGWLMYLREPDDSGLYIVGERADNEPLEEFTCDCGIGLEFPRSQTLPSNEAADLVTEFFRSGTLPASVNWKPG